MRDRLIQHDFLVPLSLAAVLIVALIVGGGKHLGWSDDAVGWAALGIGMLTVLLQQFMYEHGRDRNDASGS